MNETKFTKEEEEINSLLNDIIYKFWKLEQTHPSDKEEFAFSIHGIQKIMGMRLLRRVFPEICMKYNVPDYKYKESDQCNFYNSDSRECEAFEFGFKKARELK